MALASWNGKTRRDPRGSIASGHVPTAKGIRPLAARSAVRVAVLDWERARLGPIRAATGTARRATPEPLRKTTEVFTRVRKVAKSSATGNARPLQAVGAGLC